MTKNANADHIILKQFAATGLCSEIQSNIKLNDEPKLPSYSVIPSEYSENKYNCNRVYGVGSSAEDDNLAKIKAYGELLERLSLENPDDAKLLKKVSYNNQPEFIDPLDFYCYSDCQRRGQEHEYNAINNSEFSWIKSINYSDGIEKYIPAQLVYLDTRFDREYPIRLERISTGGACGPTPSNFALHSGLCEVIERHCFIRAFLRKENIKKITNMPKPIKDLLCYLDRYLLDCQVFIIDGEFELPTFLAITVDQTYVGPGINVGAKCGFCIEDAIISAIVESIQFRFACRLHEARGNLREVLSTEVFNLDDRLEFWFPASKKSLLSFWIDSNNKVDYRYIEQKFKKLSFDFVVERIISRGHKVFCCDISLPEMTKKNFQVLKVIIPGLLPLYLDERAIALFSMETGEITKRDDLIPHPFL